MALDFSYLGGLIPLIVFEYVFVLILCRCSRFCCCEVCREDEVPYEAENDYGYTAEIDMGNPNTPMSRKTHLRFEDTYESFHPAFKYILFFTRFLSFYYICGVAVVANYIIVGSQQWFLFSMWNTELLSIYFGCAVISSVYGIVYGEDHSIPSTIIDVEGGSRERRTRVLWSSEVIMFGRIVQILFEVCGGTAVYMTIINFTLQDPKFSFWNVTSHFITIMVLVLELFLNNMYVRADHFIFNISWGFLYLIFIWPLVVLGRISNWPYRFLELDTKTCYLYYTLLVFADIVFYFVFYALSRGKYHVRKAIHLSNQNRRRANKLDESYDNADLYTTDYVYNKEKDNEIPDADLYRANDVEADDDDDDEQKGDDVREVLDDREDDLSEQDGEDSEYDHKRESLEDGNVQPVNLYYE